MRVLIVDDDPLFRDGMQTLLACLDPGVDVTGVSVLEQIPADLRAFDHVMLDMNLPGCSHDDIFRWTAQCCERVSVVVVSGEQDPVRVAHAIEAGAVGYIPKTTDPATIVEALRHFLAHGVYLPPWALFQGAATLPAQGKVSGEALRLTPVQTKVLSWLLQCTPANVMAQMLGTTQSVVSAHVMTVYQMLGVASRAQAMYRVCELGMLPLLNYKRPVNP